MFMLATCRRMRNATWQAAFRKITASATVCNRFFAVTCADVCCSVNVLCQGKSKVAAAGPHNATLMSGLSFDLDFLVCTLVPSSSVHVLTGAIPQ